MQLKEKSIAPTHSLPRFWIGDSGQRHALAACCPRKGPPIPNGQEAGWASELVWTQRIEEKSFASDEDRIPVVHSVIKHYTD
jgi:hypothetical protein